LVRPSDEKVRRRFVVAVLTVGLSTKDEDDVEDIGSLGAEGVTYGQCNATVGHRATGAPAAQATIEYRVEVATVCQVGPGDERSGEPRHRRESPPPGGLAWTAYLLRGRCRGDGERDE